MQYKFEQLFEWSSGKPIVPTSGSIPIYGSNGIVGYTNEKKYRNKIILGRVGAYCGSVAYCPDDFNATDNTLITSCDESKICYHYAYYLLKKYQLNDYAGGAAQPLITQGLLKHLKCEIPSLEIQQKLVSILSTYDNLIENNNKQIKTLEQMAENIYKEWFVRFRFPGHETTPFENGIPKGWKIERLGNVANISTGKSNRQDADEDGIYPFFDRSQEIKRSNIWLKDCEAIIVPGEGTTFYPRYYQGKFDLHQRCYCVEPKVKEIGKFLFYVLNMNRYYFLSVATGATVPSLRQNNFLSMKYLMPSIDLCKKFNQIVSKLFDQKDHLKEENQNLIKQRDLLLPRLMSGKLAV